LIFNDLARKTIILGEYTEGVYFYKRRFNFAQNSISKSEYSDAMPQHEDVLDGVLMQLVKGSKFKKKQ
jgi:hypothetical protein